MFVVVVLITHKEEFNSYMAGEGEGEEGEGERGRLQHPWGLFGTLALWDAYNYN